MYFYFVNVSKNGRYFFSTDKRGIQGKARAVALYEQIATRFPIEEGYEVTLIRWDNPAYTVLSDSTL
ncbi:hypothetical protein HN682_03560 [Candidatus Peregrinibacteria bacterium]|jgi:hypothetical protein|nr:hypothetical protein [Candidatus Peregrinibacteria bacterium]